MDYPKYLDEAVEIIYDYIKFGSYQRLQSMSAGLAQYFSFLHVRANNFYDKYCFERDATYPPECQIHNHGGTNGQT